MYSLDYYWKCYLIFNGSCRINFDIADFIDSNDGFSENFYMRLLDNIVFRKYELSVGCYESIIISILKKTNISSSVIYKALEVLFFQNKATDFIVNNFMHSESSSFISNLERLDRKYNCVFTIDMLDYLFNYNDPSDLYRIFKKYGKYDVVKRYVKYKQYFIIFNYKIKNNNSLYDEFITDLINCNTISAFMDMLCFINSFCLKEVLELVNDRIKSFNCNKKLMIYILFLLHFKYDSISIFSMCFKLVNDNNDLDYNNIVYLISIYKDFLRDNCNDAISLLDGFVNALVNNDNISVSEFMDNISDLDDRFKLRDILNSIDISINDNLDDYSVMATRKREAFYNYIEGKRVRNLKSIARVKRISINKEV